MIVNVVQKNVKANVLQGGQNPSVCTGCDTIVEIIIDLGRLPMEKSTVRDEGRRLFIARGAAVVAAAALLQPAAWVPSPASAQAGGADVTAMEELMLEHGVLSRLLLVCERIVSNMGSKETAVSPEVTGEAAEVIASYVQEYHEKLEEKYVFPPMRERMPELVQVLTRQHAAGRVHINRIRRLAEEQVMDSPQNRASIIASFRGFIAMYRPHKAREDTVLFPAFRTVMPPTDLEGLAGIFQKEEKALGVEYDFDSVVERVEKLEKELEIFDLSRFTLTM